MNSGATQQQNIQKIKKYFDKTPIFARPTSSIFLQSTTQNRLYNNNLQTTTTAYLKTNEKGLKNIKKQKYKSIFFCIYRIIGSETENKFIQYLPNFSISQ